MPVVADLITLMSRSLLGLLFVSGGIEGWIYVLTGKDLSPKLSSPSAMEFVDGLKKARWFWGYMKGIDLLAGSMLLFGVYPRFALLLLLPVISVILLFYVFAHPRAWWFALLLGAPTLWLLTVYWLSPLGIIQL